jgi:hypothetical protein
MGLAGVELVSLACAYNLIGVGNRRGLVKALAECIAHEGVRRRVMAAHACVDVPDQFAALGNGDASLQGSRRDALV